MNLYASMPTMDDAAPYRRFCETGPDFNRSIAESLPEAIRWIKAGHERQARYWMLKVKLYAKEISLETFEAEISTL